MTQATRYSFIALFIFLPAHLLRAQAVLATDILGTWQTGAKDGKIEIVKTGNLYSGRLVWASNMFEADGKTSKKDVKNPDPAMRTRDLKNLALLTDFIFRGSVWEEGKIYDPQSGKTYSCTMKIRNKRLEIRGYVGISLFGRTEIWDKVAP